MLQKDSSVRIEVVDALRGFAIMSIMLLHNIEHFDLYFFPSYFPQWLKATDGVVWDSLFFLFSGKSYAIFALLFGLTFYIQNNNQQKKGADFRARFAWRLLLLLGFACFNSMFYQGDILGLYAIIGVILIPVCKLRDGLVFIIALLLLSQPVEWIRFFHILSHPDYIAAPKYSDIYFPQTATGLRSHSFFDLVKGNYTVGKLAVMSWFWEYGRVTQTAGLFMIGMLLGRKKLFMVSENNINFWKKTLLIAVILFVPLFFFKGLVSSFVNRQVLVDPLGIIISMWSNVAFTTILVSSFVLLYQHIKARNILNILTPIGKMTLTNYVMQSMVGSFIYYEYGLGLYKYTGAIMSLLIGIVLIFLQLMFCRWWLKGHRQGPLETLWHRGTWLKIG